MVLQEGIYHAPGDRPGRAFLILFLRAAPGLTAAEAGAALGSLWRLWRELAAGNVPDLPGHPVSPDGLTVLVGYGPNAFTLPGARRAAPDALVRHGAFRSPLPAGGGPVVIGSGLSYAPDVRLNPSTEDVAVQLIADTQLAVNRVVVETWKALHDLADPASGQAALSLTGFFQGFQRDDGRSWVDFHDGVSNLRSDQRLDAIAIKPSAVAEDAWVEAGTYLAFLRLTVDLAVWRRLGRPIQELLVGRDKLSGCAITSVDSGGAPVPLPGCPAAGGLEVTDQGNEEFRQPPDVADPVVRQSHVQRANHHQGPVSDPSSLRIFRQGYEFLEPLDSAPGFRAGLNFVSFQDTPERLTRMLRQPGWLGSTNFGGDPAAQPPGMDRLLAVRAGGIFLVPPVAGEEFPGASLFG